MIAVRAMGAFAGKSTAFRDAAIEAGAVDHLVQVRTWHAWCRGAIASVAASKGSSQHSLGRCARGSSWHMLTLTLELRTTGLGRHACWLKASRSRHELRYGW